MTYRVFDTEEKVWVKGKVYLNPYGELFIIKQSVFGWTKVPLTLSQDRYVYHRDIDLYDRNATLVYEGDYIRAKISDDKTVVGVVVYARELSAYVILCVDSDEFYTLGTEVCEYIEVIGNVFDGYEEEKQNGKPTLSQSEK